MTDFFLKFPLFYLANEEIESRKIPNNIYILNFPTPFSAGFPHSLDKRAGISKKNSVVLYSIFIHTLDIAAWTELKTV